MAKSALCSVTPNGGPAQAVYSVTCEITNGDDDAYIVSVKPYLYDDNMTPAAGSAGHAGTWARPITPVSGLLAAGSGAKTYINWNCVPFSPNGPGAANEGWYVGAEIRFSTGEVIASALTGVTFTHQP